MPNCIIVGCTNRFNKSGNGSISFHVFPRNAELREKWLAQINRPLWKPTSTSCICSAHFESDQFECSSFIRRLKRGAVPTIFSTVIDDSDTLKMSSCDAENREKTDPYDSLEDCTEKDEYTEILPDINDVNKRLFDKESLTKEIEKAQQCIDRDVKESRRLYQLKRRLVHKKKKIMKKKSNDGGSPDVELTEYLDEINDSDMEAELINDNGLQNVIRRIRLLDNRLLRIKDRTKYVRDVKLRLESKLSNSDASRLTDDVSCCHLSDTNDLCLLCNKFIKGIKVRLVGSVTPISKVAFTEKLHQLLAGTFTVVITENDGICKLCEILFHRLDTLEIEILEAKKIVMEHLSRKCSVFSNEPAPISQDNVIFETQSESQNLINKNMAFNTSSQQLVNTGNLYTTLNHVEDKPHTCRICLFQSQDVNIITTHMKIHGNAAARTKICSRKNNISNKKSTKNATIKLLRSNQLLTNQENKYACSACSFQSKDLPDIVDHMKIHDVMNREQNFVLPQERNIFQCLCCSSAFADEASRFHHTITQHTIWEGRAAFTTLS